MMASNLKIDVQDKDLLVTLREFFRLILEQEDISAIFVSQRLPMKNTIMPALVTDSKTLDRTDPLAPAFPINGAKLLSRLTRKSSGEKIAAVLRPCEIRAFTELLKLKQGKTDDLIIIGIDCLGAFRNTDYFRFVEKNPERSTELFIDSVLSGKGTTAGGIDLAPACKACEFPIAPNNADISIGLIGIDVKNQVLIEARTSAGEEICKKLNLSETKKTAERKTAVDNLVAQRIEYRDKMFAETRDTVDNLEKLTAYLAGCINCYNCRVACPVCYCKECVFVTDVFYHEPSQYLHWAKRKGILKMPSDTLFYHITRLAHSSMACVGCGQCSNACPNEISVMELFRTVAEKTQSAFGYEAGRSLDEPPPLSVFEKDEFLEVAQT
ncbi:Coenzyme F420 hydrogenase/dehydrogenase, beta subunit C-terminal domain [Desulfobacterales bacterium HSG16]|nr:Coenzyme F420 hydrogenase/dehydrogenase, beta subunit C-terminal domain [Desulfobacterales bacterium HSG16]